MRLEKWQTLLVIVVAVFSASSATWFVRSTGWNFEDAVGVPDWLMLLFMIFTTAIVVLFAIFKSYRS